MTSYDSDSGYPEPRSHQNQHLSNPDIDKVREAIDTGNLSYLRENKDMIKDMFEKNEWNTSQCWCGCPNNYSLLTKFTHPPAHDWLIPKSHGSGNSKSLEEVQTLYERSIRFLLDESVIDPNRIFSYTDLGEPKKETILSELLASYAGWEFQRKMILLFMHMTSSQVLRDYRGTGNATMLQYFLMSHAYDDGTPLPGQDTKENEFCIEVRDYLIAAGVDLSNIAHYPNYGTAPFSTLSNAIQNLSPYLVRLCMEQKADPNLIVTDLEYERHENMAMRMLFHNRFTHSPHVIADITQILAMLIQSGLDLQYLNADQRNISDYCQQNGFAGTSVDKLLSVHNAPSPTRKVYAGKSQAFKRIMAEEEDEDVYANNAIIQLLKEHRFLKDQEKLRTIYAQFKTLTVTSLPPEKDGYYSDLHNNYVGKYAWHSTPVGDHFRDLEKQARLEKEKKQQ